MEIIRISCYLTINLKYDTINLKINLYIELFLINRFLTINFKYYHINFNILLKPGSVLYLFLL